MSVLQQIREFLSAAMPHEDALAQLMVAATFAGDDLAVRLRQFQHGCGHAGFVAEFYQQNPRQAIVVVLDEFEMREVQSLLTQCLAFAEDHHRSEQ